MLRVLGFRDEGLGLRVEGLELRGKQSVGLEFRGKQSARVCARGNGLGFRFRVRFERV